MYYNNLHEQRVIQYLNSEIKRFHVINYLIEKYSLVNYLEIGVFKGENIREVRAAHKDGVDPGIEGFHAPEVNYPMSSDSFFELLEDHEDIKYDIIFIDGLHQYEQVKKDITNSLKHLQPYGFIILHDCNPTSYKAQLPNRETIAWNGDVWRSFVEFKQNNPKYECCVVDTDFGIGVIKNNNTPTINTPCLPLTYEEFDSSRAQYLNLISWDAFKTTY